MNTSEPILDVFIPGVPAPGGSKTANVLRNRDGSVRMIPLGNGKSRPMVVYRDDAKGNADWKVTCKHFVREAWRFPPLTIPLHLDVEFVMPRRKGDFGSGRNEGVLKPNAPKYHTVKPDRTKLMRSTEDALTGLLWRDDTIIVDGNISKVYGDRPGCRIIVRAAKNGQPEGTTT